MISNCAIKDYIHPATLNIDEAITFESELKRLLLFFDKVGLCMCRHDIFRNNLWGNKDIKPFGQRLEMLHEQGLVFDPVLVATTIDDVFGFQGDLAYEQIFVANNRDNPEIMGEYKKYDEQFDAIHTNLIDVMCEMIHVTGQSIDIPVPLQFLSSKWMNYTKENLEDIWQRMVRFCCFYNVDKHDQEHWIPILKSSRSPASRIFKKDKVYGLILNKMPEVYYDYDWERLLEFKADDDRKSKINALRSWVNNISLTDLSLAEIHQELEFLLEEYTNQIKLHKLKYTYKPFKIFLSGILNFFTQPTGIINDLFSLKEEKINLLIDEKNLRGREMAYLYDLQNNPGAS